jgi:hypothetical protein
MSNNKSVEHTGLNFLGRLHDSSDSGEHDNPTFLKQCMCRAMSTNSRVKVFHLQADGLLVLQME